MKKYLRICSVFILSSFLLTGCSVKKAYEQSGKKDMTLLNPGTSRIKILSEFGKPLESKKNTDGKRVDLVAFVQGYSNTEKTTRAVTHGLLDIGTWGLWEFIGTPIETYTNGTKNLVEIKYTKEEIVDKVTYL